MKTRFTPRNPCPICGGHRDLPPHRGIRCYGYQDSTGAYARCTREELAGDVKQNDDGTYSHLLHGPCNCGKEHGPKSVSVAGKSEIRRQGALVHTSSWRVHCADGSFAVHRRYDRSDGSKGFDWRYADLQLSQNGEIRSTDKLYGLACLDRLRPALLVEGEKAADAVRAVMVGGEYAILATVCGAPKVPDATVLAYLAAKVGPDGLTVWADNDAQGAKQMQGCAAIVQAHGVEVRHVTWPDAPERGDAADYCATHGKEELLALLKSAKRGPAANSSRAQTEELLEDVRAFIREYVLLPQERHYVAATLWALHTHAIDAFDVTPRLVCKSAEKESGKTRMLEVLAKLAPAPLFTINISVAAIFRVLAARMRTVFFDEVDAIFSRTTKDPGQEELRGIINAGFQRSGRVARVEMPSPRSSNIRSSPPWR